MKQLRGRIKPVMPHIYLKGKYAVCCFVSRVVLALSAVDYGSYENHHPTHPSKQSQKE